MEKALIAPCGMNCGICMAYLREKNRCPGCRGEDINKPASCVGCIVVNCEMIKKSVSGFCYECPDIPCKKIKQLDKRYRTKYRMSMIENLEYIKEHGMEKFLEKEEEKWRCPECHGIISCHVGFCVDCALEKRKSRKKEKGSLEGEAALIAPCGMNCGICSSYLAMKYNVRSQGFKMGYCVGCRTRDKLCAFITRSCRILMSGEVEYCYQCEEFPCRNLEHLDERYSERYRMSMIENLEYIRDFGIEALLEKEKEKWQCPECGGVISCHDGICYSCGVEN